MVLQEPAHAKDQLTHAYTHDVMGMNFHFSSSKKSRESHSPFDPSFLCKRHRRKYRGSTKSSRSHGNGTRRKTKQTRVLEQFRPLIFTMNAKEGCNGTNFPRYHSTFFHVYFCRIAPMTNGRSSATQIIVNAPTLNVLSTFPQSFGQEIA